MTEPTSMRGPECAPLYGDRVRRERIVKTARALLVSGYDRRSTSSSDTFGSIASAFFLAEHFERAASDYLERGSAEP